mgnify:CR=1 FL=1|jgi:protein O-GlcNAc transferase
MITDLNQDQKIKLKRLFEQKNYSKFQLSIEKLGSIDELPIYLKMGYAGSIVLNSKSKKEDFVKATVIFENIYSKDKSNLSALHNLILSSLKADLSGYVLPHLIDFYQKNNKDAKIVEGLARIYFQLDNMDLSVKFFKKLMKLNPISTIDGGRLSYLASMNYPSNINQQDYYNECIKLGEKFDEFSLLSPYEQRNFSNDKIKIGFLSGDFRDHSMNYFLKDVVEKIDKNSFYIIGLSNLELTRHDEVITKFYQSNFDEWYNIIHYNDEQLLDFVRSLDLDILIDLNGFTFGNRLNIFAARSAKKQVAWCGYNNSLGIKNMDYIIADKNLIKQNEENLYKEKIIYMPKIWNAMSKPGNLPAINELPYNKNKLFKFGSFNSFKKISNDTIKVWSKILNSSNCELYLKNSGGYNQEVYDNLQKRFEIEKVDLKKIILLKKSKNSEFMKDYHKIDLALDTFPYTGVTTSFQSYLMGVPVLTMKGFNFNSRCGESINTNLGLEEFIAENHDDYIKKSISLQNKNELSKLRSSLRDKVLNSPLFDTETFTKDLSNIFQNIIKSN